MQTPRTWSTVVRSRFDFEIDTNSKMRLPNPAPKPKPFRDPAGPFVLREVVSRLKEPGLRVSDVKPGKACDAYVAADLLTLQLSVILIVNRKGDNAKFLLWMTPRKAAFRRVSLNTFDLSRWEDICNEVEEILKQKLQVSSLRRVTHDEAFRRT